MLIGTIADDFTGAGDIANTLAKTGMRTLLVLGVPDQSQDSGGAHAVVVALKSRSIEAGEAVWQSLQALDWLKTNGAEQIVFKYCSTFDSTPEGNIGPVAEALAERLGTRGVVVCPAFPDAGRTVYEGHLFVHDRLLNESGMEKHPLNPMTDPDIRRWLRLQTKSAVGHVRANIVRQGAEAVRQALAAKEETLVVADAVSNEDLLALGKAVAGAPLVTGGSGIASGLPDNFRTRGWQPETSASLPSLSDPAAILAGSCSNATRAQIADYAAQAPSLKLDIDRLMSGEIGLQDCLAFASEHQDTAPLIYSSAEPAEVAAAQQRYGRESLAHKLDALFGELAHALVERGVRRLVVAGGETAGAAMTGLGVRQLWLGPEIATGVPLLIHDQGWTGGLVLKSGNFGGPRFFSEALQAMGSAHAG